MNRNVLTAKESVHAHNNFKHKKKQAVYERNEKEPTDSKVVLRVRGSPEKRIYLKKFVLSNQMDMMTTKTNQRVAKNKL